MNHFEVYKRNHNRLQNIAGFLIFLTLLSLLFSFTVSEIRIAINSMKFVFICFLAYKLLDGKKWAVSLVIIISIISMVQLILGILNFQSITHVIILFVFLIGFGIIVKYLGNSKEFDSYFRLRENGFVGLKSEGKKFQELVKDECLIKVKHKEVNEANAYIELLEEIALKTQTKNKIIEVRNEDTKINIETEDTIYTVFFNDQYKFFDRKFVDKVNSVLIELGSSLFIYFVWPESVLNQNEEYTYLACLDEIGVNELRENGYTKKEE